MKPNMPHPISRNTFLTQGLLCALLTLAFPACSKGDGESASLKGRITADGPVGIYFMTRFWTGGTLEKVVWYFDPDGGVYQNLETGATAADLAAHQGRKGTRKLAGGEMSVTWADGKTSKSRFEADRKGGAGFGWDAGIFSPVDPITDPKVVVGKFEGGESLSGGGSSAATSNAYEFRADGTYTRTGVASLKSTSSGSTLSGGATGVTTGTWKAEGYTITLTESGGKPQRRMAFPWKDDNALPLPNRLYLGGIMIKRQ